MPYYIGPSQQADIEGARMKKDRRREKEVELRRRSLLYTTESAMIDHR
jgi:hypothetical protein